MKIAHLTTVDLSLRYLLLPQMMAALEAGHEVVGISAGGPHVQFLEERGIRHIELDGSTRSMDLRSDARACANLWSILRREQLDVLHTHNPKPGVYGRIIGRLAGVPRIVNTSHGLYATPEDTVARRAVVYMLEGLASRASDLELVQNPEDLELLARYRLVAERKLRFLGNGVDVERFSPATLAQERAGARRELDIADDDIVVGCVARLVREKGIPELLDALRDIGPPIRGLLVGEIDDSRSDAIGSHVLRSAIENGAMVVGHRDDVERMYAAMDVFCLPSHREGFPRAAMEAASCGLPVVSTDVRGCRSVVDDGITGTLVRSRDVCDLSSALRRYLDPQRRREQGRAGREKAVSEFDERRIVRDVLRAYEG